jgi:hypothetical protein
MGFWETLFGQGKPSAPRRDDLFRLSTALPDIEDRLGVTYQGRAAVLMRPIEAQRFQRLEEDVERTLGMGGKDLAVTSTPVTDELGYHWIVLRAAALDSALAAVRLVENLVDEGGFGDALTAVATDFGAWMLVYGYRKGRFYPFAQTGRETRDVAREMRVAALLDPMLPMEKDPAQWYPLWDPPWGDPSPR